MSSIKCKNCGTDIDTPETGPDQPLVTCPNCDAVFDPSGKNNRLTLPSPALRSLPSKMSIQVLDDELGITRRWGGLGHLVLFGIVSFMLTVGLFFSQVLLVETLFNPLTWFMFGLGYYSLRRLVNSTVVKVSPEQVTVKEGPLPFWKNIDLDARDIEQVYVKQYVQRSKKGSTTTYQVHLVSTNGKHKELLAGLDKPEQALYLEQEIERYLGIKDRRVRDEYKSLAYNFSGWRRFARRNKLRYTPGKLLEGHRVDGRYRGYDVDLMVVQSYGNLTTRTRLTLTAANRGTGGQNRQELSLADVANLLAAPSPGGAALTGQFKMADEGKEIIYEQNEVETEETFLQAVFETAYRLVEAYPRIAALGGEVVPVLRPVAEDKKHPARAIAAQLIQDIAPTTEYLRHYEEISLLCPRCLMRCTTHKADLSLLNSVVYFGCRNCHQSHNFLTIDQVTAVLDNQAEAEPVQQGDTLVVNWLRRKTLFDFDRVEIMGATDEDVERFVVQVGNNTDPVSQARYKEIRCVVSPDCKLSDNSMRILQHTFGQVEVNESTPLRKQTKPTADQITDSRPDSSLSNRL